MLCVVLSFNGCEDTMACLASIARQGECGIDVLVIDNASQAGTVERLRARHPEVELIALSENLGWAGGNNVGIRLGLERGYGWICLLNNDTEFPPGALAGLKAAADALPPCLLHPAIHYWDEPHVAQLRPGADAHPEHYTGGLWHGKPEMRHAYGACLAVHRSIFEKVGLIDERFFLQCEETDFYFRCVAEGFHSVCAPEVTILHKESRAFGGRRAPIKTYYTVRNSLLLAEKKRQGLQVRLHDTRRLYWTVANLARAEMGPAAGLPGTVRWLLSSSDSAAAVRMALSDYAKRRFGRISDNGRARLAPPA